MANSNGAFVAKLTIGILSGLAGVLAGSIAAGMWLGVLRAETTNHLQDTEKHPSRAERVQIVTEVLSIGVLPVLNETGKRLETLERVQAKQADQLDRIEALVRDVKRAQ